jgi:uncharacterized protein (TIGR03067 family)
MKLQLLALALIVPVSLGTVSAQDDAVKKELAGLAGEWRLVKGEANGEAANDYIIENLKCAIKGDRITFGGVKTLTDKFSELTIKIDGSTMPKCIDLKVQAGSLKGDVLEGVYECKGDELKLCLYVGKGNRPLEFKAEGGSDRVLFVLKREKQ